MTRRHLIHTLATVAIAASPAGAADKIEPGAYCALPKAGETPKCLAPAREEYDAFFDALDEGALSDEQTARLERDVAAGAGGSQPYLALSSLSYGYFRLAQRVAASGEQDAAVVARLDRWNALLAQAYVGSEEDDAYRDAVRDAAEELEERTTVALRCVDGGGVEAACNSTESVLRGINAASREVGIEGALERLIERILGGSAT